VLAALCCTCCIALAVSCFVLAASHLLHGAFCVALAVLHLLCCTCCITLAASPILSCDCYLVAPLSSAALDA
jgi:hypothetical protein